MGDSTDTWPPVTPAELRAAGFIVPEPEHRLIGSVCICGDWWAQCGNDIPEQWRQHVNAAERAASEMSPSPGEGA